VLHAKVVIFLNIFCMGDCIFHGGFEWSQAAFFQGSQNGDNQVYGVMEAMDG
jgi:hypothetical protein